MPRKNPGRIDGIHTGGDAAAVTTQLAATTTFTSIDFDSGGALYLVVIFDVTNIGTASLTLSIRGVDAASGKTWTILTGAAVVANSTVIYRIGPTLTPVANLTVADIVPVTFRLVVTAGNSNPASYTLGHHLVP